MRRKMLRTVGILSLSVALSVSLASCAGQGNHEPGASGIQRVELQDDNGTSNSSEIEGNGETEGNGATGGNSNEESSNGGKTGIFYDGANLSGRVVEFSDTGCIITPETLIVYEDGGMAGGIAVPGYESDDTNITITYTEDTVFQIINFSMAEQKEISREDADKSSVKKETNVNIFGTCQEEQNWTADKVVITRWQ